MHDGIRATTNTTLQTMQSLQQEAKVESFAAQVEAKDNMKESVEEAVNPFGYKMQERQKKVKAHSTRIQKLMEGQEKMQPVKLPDQFKDTANQFEQRNPELKADKLIALRAGINPKDSKEEILKKIKDQFQDISLIDEALDYLLETSDGELYQTLLELKQELNEQNEREILAGRNIGAEAREASEKGLGTPSSLRDQYRDLTGNPREANVLFQELSNKYNFKELQETLKFFFNALGADMKSEGPSIERGKLHTLINETRSLQAILGVYRFFQGRMNLMQSLFNKEGIPMPRQLTFELMAKQFMGLVGDRYPSSSKFLQSTERLGVEKWIQAKIIALSQFRDATKSVSLEKIYKSLQHRDDFFLALLEALEDLEDELEALEEKEEEEEDEEEEGEEEEEEEEE